jgi:hypothetical protein
MTNFVVDASIARACSENTAIYPIATQCRELLLKLQESSYGVVMTKDIQAQWQEYSSDFTEKWLREMTGKRRLKVISSPETDLEIRSLIEPMAKTDQERSAMNKDILLLEAALATDRRIVSLDENATYKYYIANKGKVVKFQQLIWVNPKDAMSSDLKRLQITEKIIEDWGSKPQSRICMAILDYLLNNNTVDSSHITYNFLQESVKKSEQEAGEDRDLWLAIQYLCGERVHLLEAKFELIDNGISFPISNSLLNDARKTGELVHPENSKLISDFEDKVFIYFQPSTLVQSTSV